MSRITKVLTILLLALTINSLNVYAQDQKKEKILFVVTSHGEKGDTGEPTGYYLSEVAHPWAVLMDAGYEIEFVSPEGGSVPVDGFDVEDPINRKFWLDKEYQIKLNHTKKPNEVNPDDYVAIHFAGGHGTMWDFPNNKKLAKIASTIYEKNGVVSAVCHGPAGLVNIKLSNGKYLVDGKTVSTFTNEEERAVELEDVVPFLLETKLEERGAIISKADNWQSKVSVDGRLITGQNPASAHDLGKAIVEVLQTK
ncbi:type 1 glutamine amidotransferase domain-containing protein [Fulvivirga sp. RKSG066]|uniref:type 1 glutamine amidotransferase domain-containing protein n=1 Tax=Fulvivirga aurantia TaxID=2529383 RepID=UPI0012BC9841|nr:type 1 glutamine amidotransferase domain-containing protein [Fulvivirga aurantia]MTI21212.1 type 1 glutamine amidotransferase domain-containing protein [Fulvivirga aurantia]